MNESIKIRTTVPNSWLKKKLFEGFFIALIGVTGIMSAGIILSEPTINRWGLYIYLFGIGLIAVGLLPYRKLSQLQNKPNQFKCTDDKLEFWVRDQCKLIIPIQSIQSISYSENGGKGEIELKVNEYERINKKLLDSWEVSCGQKNLKFRYFSRKSFNELDEILKTDSCHNFL